MQDRATAITHIVGGFPRRRDWENRVEKFGGELAYLDMLLDNAIARCMHAYREAFEFINNISDSQLRQILRLRYLDDLTWYKVARGIGEHDEQYPRKKHDRLLKTLKCEEESP